MTEEYETMDDLVEDSSMNLVKIIEISSKTIFLVWSEEEFEEENLPEGSYTAVKLDIPTSTDQDKIYKPDMVSEITTVDISYSANVKVEPEGKDYVYSTVVPLGDAGEQ